MLKFDNKQKILTIGNIRIGGQPGENPIVLVGSVFYKGHQALLNEKTGKIDEKIVEQEVNEFLTMIEETGMQAIIDVIGAYPEALLKHCEYIANIVDCPFLVDGLNDDIRIPAMEGLKEIGLLDRAILNSIDDNTNDENLEKLKNIGVKNAVLLTFSNRAIFPEQKLKFLIEKLIPISQKAQIENLIVDTAVLDLPTGFAPSNAIYGWDFIKKYGDSPRCGAIASIMTYCANAGSDFILFGGIKHAKCVIPSIALISGINSYYRKRILKKEISERSPLKRIF